MPKDKQYEITIKVKDKSQHPPSTIKTKICLVEFDASGNPGVPKDKQGNPLTEDESYNGNTANTVLEGFDDQNPSWVKINGKWYYI